MDYSVHDAWRAGFRRAVFVIRPDLEEAFERLIGQRYRGRLEVLTVQQRLDEVPSGVMPAPGRIRPWGTSQAVLAARPRVSGGFAGAQSPTYSTAMHLSRRPASCGPRRARVPTPSSDIRWRRPPARPEG